MDDGLPACLALREVFRALYRTPVIIHDFPPKMHICVVCRRTGVNESLASGSVVGLAGPPHGVLFLGVAEERIRTKLLKDGQIDTVIGLPANLFYSTGIPVCILVLKKCKKPDDVLVINAAEHF